MSCFLARLALGDKNRIALTHEEYAAARSHIRSIFEALEIEEKFDLVLGNYQEFEEELLRLGVSHVLYKTLTWHSLGEDRRILNRRINNLLSACRLYIDQLRHSLKAMYGDPSPELLAMDTARGAEYDANFSYRLLEELRNYTQHRRLPVNAYSISQKVTVLLPQLQVAHAITPQLTIKPVLEDEKIKKSFLPELRAQPDVIDLKPHVRNYVESLANVHKKVRSIIDRDSGKWEETILGLCKRYKGENSEASDVGLYIMSVAEEEPETVQEKHAVFVDPLNSMRALQQTNTVAPNFSKHFVTGQETDRILQDT